MINQEKLNNSSEFELERYKFILKQIHFLNENIHKHITLFQTLTTAVIGASIAVFVSWQKLNINAEIAKMAINGLLGVIIFLSVFVILFLLSGIYSWFDYRKEEVEILNSTIHPGFRSLPKLRNFWRWHETYVILCIIVFVITICIFTENQIIPLIN